MKKLMVLLVMTLVMAVGGSPARSEMTNLDQVILLDVQGLWGGTDLWISRDGTAVCRFVGHAGKGESGLQETRYSFQLSGEQLSSLLDLVNKHSFFTIKTNDRRGYPDEAHPVIFIKTGDESRAVIKWASDEHADFDPIYHGLLEIAGSGKQGTELKKCAFDANWKPDGFPENKAVWGMLPKARGTH